MRLRLGLVALWTGVPLATGATPPTLEDRVESLLAGARARRVAAALVDVRTGRVLAHAARNAKGPDRSLTQRAWAPAASVFKIVTTAALLEDGVSPSQRVCYSGGLRRLMPRDLLDDPRRDLSCRTLSEALSQSTNAVFAKLASRHLDREELTRYARAFGFRDRLAPGLEPSPADIPADDFERARTAAGFFHVKLSALHGALLAGAVARGGEMPLPGGESRRVMREDTARALGAMLVDTTTHGTARKAFFDRRGRPYLGKVKVAGKTGSLAERDPTFRDYSWFVGYAPAEKPTVAVGVVVENGPRWWTRGHFLAREILQTYFKNRPPGTLARR
jgi:cell division protein FtsI/penicillin-binding protein 2